MKPKIIILDQFELRYPGFHRLDFKYLESLLEFKVATQHLYELMPGVVGGNHSHDKVEALVGLDSGLELHWQDKTGKVCVELMYTPNEMKLCIIPRNLAHAVRNNSKSPSFLVEYADKKNVQHTQLRVI